MALTSGRARRPVASHTMALTVLAVVLALGMVAGVALLVRSVIDQGDPALTMVRGSGVPAAETRDLPAFTKVELSGSNTVAVRVGRPQSVTVRADDNLLSLVTTAVRAGTLRIGERAGYSAEGPMSVTVAVPAMTAVTLSGSGTLTVRGVRGPSLTVDLPGSGTVRAVGKVGLVTATLAGSGNLELQNLVARAANARIDGSGQIRVHVTRSLVAVVSGSGVVRYSGDPQAVVDRVTGSGSVTPD